MNPIHFFINSISERIKKIVKSNRVLISNFLSLSVLQFLNMVLPLVTLPYLLRVIGVENVGLLAFAQASVYYFQIITEYGFNLTATRDISINIGNKETVKEIYNEVMTTKIFLFLVSGVVLFIIVFSVEYFKENYLLYLFYYISLFGQLIFPIWFFQGVQQMKYITYVNLISKTVFTVLIFLVVTDEHDYFYVPLLLAFGNVLAGFFSLFYLYKKFEIFFQFQPFSKVKRQLYFGSYIFLSQLKITLFSNTNTVVLGLIGGNFSVGLFNTAEKIIRAFASLQIPVVNTLFPYISKSIKVDLNNTYNKLIKISLYGTIIYIILLTPLFVFSDKIVILVGTYDSLESSKILKILIVLPITIFLNNLFGTQILLNLQKDKLFFKIILITALTNVVLIFPLTYKYDYIGTAISVLITELLLCLLMWIYAVKEINIRKLKIDNNR